MTLFLFLNRYPHEIRIQVLPVITVLIVFFMMTPGRAVQAQILTVKQLNTQKANWPQLAEQERRVQFIGRFRSSAGTLQLEKFDVSCRLPGTIRLPERMPSGESLEVTGKFVLENGKLSFLVSRLIHRGLVHVELKKRAAVIPSDQSDALLELAREYVDEAEFYKDEKTQAEIATIRAVALETKRRLANGDSKRLSEVQTLAVSLSASPVFLENLKFEILFIDSKAPNADRAKLLERIQQLEAWDRQIPPVPERLKESFAKEAPQHYDSGTDSDREWLHRLLYSTVRTQQILAQLKTDGSNGLELADLIRREFSDQNELCQSLEQKEVDFQLGKVPSLSRQELQRLTLLLERLNKGELTQPVLQKWLSAQENQFDTDTLPGLLRTADEYLFVGDTWKLPERTEQGIEFLKRSWAMASTQSPDDAKLIADRLAALGWENLGGRWLTKREVQMLPRDDLQLALREGRVVKGMTELQVTKFLGKPNRIARIGSSRSLRELWIYDGEGNAGLVVRFQHEQVAGFGRQRVVEDVSRIP